MNIPIPHDIKGLIFDLDGTVVDSMPLHYDAYNHALKPWGIQYSWDLFLSRGGIPTPDTMQMIGKENKVAGFDVEEALKRKKKFVDENIEKITLIQPVMQVIKTYHGKLPMAVGTGSNRPSVTKIFDLLGLNKYFEHSVSSSDVKQSKPHPETFLKCAELIGVNPVDCVVFEDGKPGMVAAETAGMQLVDVTKYL